MAGTIALRYASRSATEWQLETQYFDQLSPMLQDILNILPSYFLQTKVCSKINFIIMYNIIFFYIQVLLTYHEMMYIVKEITKSARTRAPQTSGLNMLTKKKPSFSCIKKSLKMKSFY